MLMFSNIASFTSILGDDRVKVFFFLCTLKTAALGGFILFFGFLAFNGGSLGSISNPGDADTVALVITNTVIGGELRLGSFNYVQQFLTPSLAPIFKTLNLFYFYHHYHSGAAGALTAMLIKRLGYAEKYWSLLFTINGGLTGMVRL